jgi:hypothetical protein
MQMNVAFEIAVGAAVYTLTDIVGVADNGFSR